MPSIKEFEAWVLFGGCILREYGTWTEGNAVHCFIPSFPGVPFSVHWKDFGSGKFTAGYILVDGSPAPGRFLNGGGETFRSGLRSGVNSEIPFVFANLPMDMPRPPCGSRGTVELKIMIAERGEGIPNNNPDMLTHQRIEALRNYYDHKDEFLIVAATNEKPYVPQFPLTWESKPAGGSRGPDGRGRSYVKFIFHYRPHGWLKEHGLLDLPPNDPPRMRIPKKWVRDPLSTVIIPKKTKSGDDDDDEEEEEEEDDDDDDDVKTNPKEAEAAGEGETEGNGRSGRYVGWRARRFVPMKETPLTSKEKWAQTKAAAQNKGEGEQKEDEIDLAAEARRMGEKHRDFIESGRARRQQELADAQAKRHALRDARKAEMARQKAEERAMEGALKEAEKQAVRAAASKGKGKARAPPLLPPPPANAQMQLYASNTYILPAGSTAGLQPGSSSSPGYPASYAPFPVPSQAPSGRPSAIIDTHMLAQAYRQGQASTSAAGGSNAAYSQQYSGYPTPRFDYGNSN